MQKQVFKDRKLPVQEDQHAHKPLKKDGEATVIGRTMQVPWGRTQSLRKEWPKKAVRGREVPPGVFAVAAQGGVSYYLSSLRSHKSVSLVSSTSSSFYWQFKLKPYSLLELLSYNYYKSYYSCYFSKCSTQSKRLTSVSLYRHIEKKPLTSGSLIMLLLSSSRTLPFHCSICLSVFMHLLGNASILFYLSSRFYVSSWECIYPANR